MIDDVFTAKRLRQVLNDLKRRPEDAAKELGVSEKKIKSLLSRKSKINLNIIKKILKKWPVDINYFINSKFSVNEDPKLIVFKKKHSASTSRIIKRKNKNYYEYQDTAMARNAPFRPEWIRTLCIVKNNNPNNSSVIWNKGHLLHQFTYFVGNINFYYRNKNGKKKVAKMKTGDSMYISPYVPHSFASRDNNLNFIIALTYQDKITNNIQENLSRLGLINSKKMVLDISNFYKSSKSLIKKKIDNSFLSNKEVKKRIKKLSLNKNNYLNSLIQYADALNINLRDLLAFNTNKKVEIIKKNSLKYWFYPTKKKKIYFIKELASTKFVPEAKSFEIKVLKNNNFKNVSYSHQYAYVLSDKLKLKIDNKIYNLKKGDTFYIKPFTKFTLSSNESKVLILRVSDAISGDNLLQISQIGKNQIGRVISENQRWY